MYTTLESCTDSTGHDDILVMLDAWAHGHEVLGIGYDPNEGEVL